MKRSILCLAGLVPAIAVAGPFHLTVVHTNDLHAHVDPVQLNGRWFGGYSQQATLVKDIQSREKNVMVLSGGDTFQGTLWFRLFHGLADASVMNYIGYQASAVGNHEFDDGPKALGEFAEAARFKLYSANLDVSREPLLRGLIQPYGVIVVAGEKVGLVGAITPDLPEISNIGPNVRMKPLLTSVKRSIEALQRAKVNKIILLSHVGLDLERELAINAPGIDLIVGGHSHTLLGARLPSEFPKTTRPYPLVQKHTKGGPTLLVSAWEWGKVLGHIGVDFDSEGKITGWSGAPIPVVETTPTNDTVDYMLAPLRAQLEQYHTRVVGTLAARFDAEQSGVRETQMGDLMADSMLAATKSVGAQLAIMNGGGVRAGLEPGQVTYDVLAQAAPFANHLVVVKLSGAKLLDVLEHGVRRLPDNSGSFPQVSSNVHMVIDVGMPSGSRVTAMIDDVPLDEKASYTVVVNSFSASGGDGNDILARSPQTDTKIIDLDALISYLESHPGLTPAPLDRTIIRQGYLSLRDASSDWRKMVK